MKTLVAIGILIVIASSCSASMIEIDGGNGQAVGQILLDHKFNKTLGVFAFGQQCEGWSQFYAGPTISGEYFTLSLGVGREQYSEKPRYGGSFWIGEGKFSALYIREHGVDGWDRLEVDYQLDSRVTFGATTRNYSSLETGLNGIVSYSVGKPGAIKLSFGELGEEVSWVVSF